MKAEVIRTPLLPSYDNIGIAHAVRYDNLLFISGQIPLDQDGNIVAKGDVTAQAEYLYDLLIGILGEVGGSLANVVKLNTFYVEPDDFAKMAAVRKRYFNQGHLAASTAVCVRALPHADALIEIEAIAILDQD